MFAAVCLAGLLLGADATKVALMPTQIDKSAAGQVPGLIDDYLLAAVQKLGGYSVIGQSDIDAMIGFEEKRQLVGCDDVSCFAQIGGALGVSQVARFKVAKAGADWVVTGTVLDIKRAAVLNRSSDFVSGDSRALLESLNGIVAHLLQPNAAEAGGPAEARAVDTPEKTPPAEAAPEPASGTVAAVGDSGSSPSASNSGLYVGGGAAFAGHAIDRGVSGYAELGYRFAFGLEAGVAVTVPVNVSPQLRYIFWHRILDVGAVVALPLLFDGIAVAGGLSVAVPYHTSVGEWGARVEALVGKDLANDGLIAPLIAYTYWKL